MGRTGLSGECPLAARSRRTRAPARSRTRRGLLSRAASSRGAPRAVQRHDAERRSDAAKLARVFESAQLEELGQAAREVVARWLVAVEAPDENGACLARQGARLAPVAHMELA